MRMVIIKAQVLDTHKEEFKLQQQNDVIINKTAEDSLSILDLSHSTYEVFLKPKGEISLTLGGNIKGEFDSVLVKGVVLKQTNLHQKQKVAKHSADHSALNLNNKSQIISNQKKSETKSFYEGNWVLFFFLIFLIGLYCYFKRGKLQR